VVVNHVPEEIRDCLEWFDVLDHLLQHVTVLDLHFRSV
jgi:hypothetical protein